jgi:hypothetical protein
MMAVLLILTFSGALFMYWFRYCCILILQTRSAQAAAEVQHASSLGLRFPGVRAALDQPALGTGALDELNASLIRDFDILGPLLASSPSSVDPVMRWMLVLDYWLLRICYQATRRFARSQAQAALHEISLILGFFASTLAPPALRRAEI